ncbi:MAG: hypothetical protein ACRDSP_00045 [Pseudonocardiaceae bacterium]
MSARRVCAAVVVAAASVLLCTGCDPATTGTTTGGSSCDPSGFGPLSGCSSPTTGTSSISACDPAWVARAAERDRRDAQPGETWAVSDGCGDTAASDPQTKAASQAWDKQFDQALKAGPPAEDGTVVAVNQDGFAECVVDVDDTDGSHERFTEPSCPKVGSRYHQNGGW